MFDLKKQLLTLFVILQGRFMKIIECTKSYEAVSGHGGLLINMSKGSYRLDTAVCAFQSGLLR